MCLGELKFVPHIFIPRSFPSHPCLLQAAASSGNPTKVLETRKTVPGLRLVDKWAVLIGGSWFACFLNNWSYGHGAATPQAWFSSDSSLNNPQVGDTTTVWDCLT